MSISAFARKNVRRSKSVIFMIALASMLICAVMNLAAGIQQSVVDSVAETAGDSHAGYANVTEAQVALLSQRGEVARIDLHLNPKGIEVPVRNAQAEIGVTYSSGLGQMAGYELASGRPPAAENEAAIPPHVAELCGGEI